MVSEFIDGLLNSQLYAGPDIEVRFGFSLTLAHMYYKRGTD